MKNFTKISLLALISLVGAQTLAMDNKNTCFSNSSNNTPPTCPLNNISPKGEGVLEALVGIGLVSSGGILFCKGGLKASVLSTELKQIQYNQLYIQNHPTKISYEYNEKGYLTMMNSKELLLKYDHVIPSYKKEIARGKKEMIVGGLMATTGLSLIYKASSL